MIMVNRVFRQNNGPSQSRTNRKSREEDKGDAGAGQRSKS